ncbi:MAG: phosphomethylpyrimidine synthase, partial [Candidatus Methanomethylicota archaeon]
MATQLIEARKGIISEEIKIVAKEEGIDPQKLARMVAKGLVIIPKNIRR